MLGSENAPQDASEQLNRPAEGLTHDVATSNRLPAGTGPGTSGKAATGQYAASANPDTFQTRSAEAGLSSSQGVDITGYGTDAAAASGGTLDSTHQADSTRVLYSDNSFRSDLLFQGPEEGRLAAAVVPSVIALAARASLTRGDHKERSEPPPGSAIASSILSSRRPSTPGVAPLTTAASNAHSRRQLSRIALVVLVVRSFLLLSLFMY